MKKTRLYLHKNRRNGNKYTTLLTISVMLLLILPSVSLGKTIENTTSHNQQICSENWTEQEKLTASDPDVLSFFGLDLSLDGEWALIGAHGDDDNGFFSGAVYAFKKTGTTWTEEQKLLASDGEADDLFGSCVCLDGEYAIVGKPDTNSPGASYIFKNNDGTWVEEQILTASDGELWDEFGTAVSLDGDYALVGAQFDDDIGSAYIFKREGTLWTEEAKLIPSEGELWDCFGSSVALQGDTAVVGALNHDDSTGAIYIFRRNGSIWTEKAILIGSDSQVQDRFGLSVEIQENRVVAGARLCNNDFRGAVYVFKYEEGTWSEEQKLIPSDSEECQGFGQAISIDGDCIFVGAPSEKTNTGSAYVFTYDGDTWSESQKLLASDSAQYDEFGCAISLMGDTAMIGKYAENDYTGSVYVFMKESQNLPPNTPTVTGPAKGKIKVAIDYNFTTTDPDDDDVYYLIDWDDGTKLSWIGPYSSGEIITQSHTWTKKGDYTIKAKAKDIYGNESDWGELSVTMPCSSNLPFMLFWERLLERFPNAFPLLRYIRGY